MEKGTKPSEIIDEFLNFLKYCDKEYKDCVTQVYKYDRMNQDFLHDIYLTMRKFCLLRACLSRILL